MVLINTVTVEAINTALIALQRGENITIGGEKSGTVNNINVTNNGTGSGIDVSPQLNALDKRVTEVEKTEEELKTENERQNERIAGLEGLGIESVEFEEGSRTLFIYLVNGDVLDVVIPDRPLSLSLNGTTLTLSSDGQTLSNVELPFIPSSEKGVANGVATLDSSGRIPSTQMPTNIVNSVNTMTGDVVLNGTNVNYDNQSDSPTLKSKIDSVETKADTQVDWNESNSSSLAFIKNKPTIPAAQEQSDWTQTNSSSKSFIKNKIPIWIRDGASGDDMSPIDSVVNGNMRPVTSNAVYDVMSQTFIIYDSNITDCNNAYQKGNTVTYFLNTTVSNLPNTNNGWYVISQCNPQDWSGNNYVTQIATPSTNNNVNDVYIRHAYFDSTMTWTSWVKLTTTTELQKYEEAKWGEGYSSNTYASGYYKLFEIRSLAQSGNHDVGAFGKLMFSMSSSPLIQIYDFTICSRYYNQGHSTSKFVVNPVDKNTQTPPFTATRKILSNGQIVVSVYGQVTINWERLFADVELLFSGDMYPSRKLNSGYLTVYNNNYVASIPSDENVIART